VSAAGVTVEADRAQRGRDLGDDDEVARALGDIEMYVMRVEAAAEVSGLPVEAAWLSTARADAARAAGEPAAELWAESAAAWATVERPYRVAIARWREAEAHVAADDRETAADAAGAALEIARRLGARWLAGEIEGLVARARLRLDGADDDEVPDGDGDGHIAARPEDPFGLTPRERQVLALVARGATNRQIGAQLFMAEKTASVHVSRILAKLDVRSRTQAAAVAHRLGLAE
jgi:DNA-binding CsgD family transcriptional regulator